MNINSLLLARWIMPVQPDGLVLEYRALAVSAGRIIGIPLQQEAQENIRP